MSAVYSSEFTDAKGMNPAAVLRGHQAVGRPAGEAAGEEDRGAQPRPYDDQERELAADHRVRGQGAQEAERAARRGPHGDQGHGEARDQREPDPQVRQVRV